MFILELSLTNTADHIKVDNPLLTPQQVSAAWGLLGDFLIDIIDDLEPDATDERFREVTVELLYKLIYREMTTLVTLPIAERNEMERIASRRSRGKKGDS